MRQSLATKLVVVIGILCQCPVAQKPVKRMRLGGYVRDEVGKAWVGARVHLISRLVPGNEWIGEADRILVKSDKRGRFAAEVLPGRDYLIWAVSEPVDGVYRSTYPLLGVRSGPVRLRERSARLVQVAIRVRGDKSWLRPFHAKVTGAPARLALGEQRVGDPYEVFPLRLDEQGKALLPLLPWREVTVEIYDKRGVQLWAPIVALSLPARKAVLDALPKAENSSTDMLETMTSVTASELRLPEPKERKLTVLDGVGLPIADAELCQRIRGKLVLIAKSDAQGIVTTQLPTRYESHWDRIFKLLGASRLVIRRQGYLEVPAEVNSGGPPRAALLLGNKAKREIRMTKSSAKSGRILLAPGKAFANAQLILYVRGFGSVHNTVLLTTDKDGRYEFTQRTQSAWLLVALLDDATRHLLSSESGIPLARYAVLAAHGGKSLGNETEIDLSSLRRIEFNLQRSDGSPASFANVDCFRFSGFNAIPPLVQMRADRRGRLAMLIGSCNTMLLVAQDEHGFAARNLNSLQDQTELVLGGMLRLSGVLENAKGECVRGAIVRVEARFISQFSHTRKQKSTPRLIMGFHLIHKFRKRSDASGRFSLWVPEGTQSLPLSLTPPGTRAKTVHSIEMNGASKSSVKLVID